MAGSPHPRLKILHPVQGAVRPNHRWPSLQGLTQVNTELGMWHSVKDLFVRNLRLGHHPLRIRKAAHDPDQVNDLLGHIYVGQDRFTSSCTSSWEGGNSGQ